MRDDGKKASILMQRLSFPTETVLSNKIIRNINFLSSIRTET